MSTYAYLWRRHRGLGVAPESAVHPRVCGEQTSSISLISQRFLLLENSTEFFSPDEHQETSFLIC